MLISIKLSRITAATQLIQTHSVKLRATALGSSPILVTPTGVIMRLGIISQAFSRAAPDHGRKVLADQQTLNGVSSIAGLTGSKSIMLAGKSLPCSSGAACKFLDCQKRQCLMLVLSRLLFWNVPRNGIQIVILMRASPLLKISSKRHRPHTNTCSLLYNRVACFYTICHAFVTMTTHAGQAAFVQPVHGHNSWCVYEPGICEQWHLSGCNNGKRCSVIHISYILLHTTLQITARFRLPDLRTMHKINASPYELKLHTTSACLKMTLYQIDKLQILRPFLQQINAQMLSRSCQLLLVYQLKACKYLPCNSHMHITNPYHFILGALSQHPGLCSYCSTWLQYDTS